MLREGKTRILDIAVDCGFGSHEVFTRTFKDADGFIIWELPAQEYEVRGFEAESFEELRLSLEER